MRREREVSGARIRRERERERERGKGEKVLILCGGAQCNFLFSFFVFKAKLFSHFLSF